jgi:hypothetical protein
VVAVLAGEAKPKAVGAYLVWGSKGSCIGCLNRMAGCTDDMLHLVFAFAAQETCPPTAGGLQQSASERAGTTPTTR